MPKLEILEVGPRERALEHQFVELPFRLYRGSPQWVPPFRAEIRALLRRRLPFFEHSQAACLLARRGGEAVGRIAVFENRVLNRRSNSAQARFYHFECADDPESARALFAAAADWALERGLTELAGPHRISGLDGSGLLIDGFAERATMTMMPYHPPYYRRLIEAQGFEKARDLFTAVIDAAAFVEPEKIRRVAELHARRGRFRVPELRRKRELLGLARQIGEVYNRSFVSHYEFCPLSDSEIDGLARDLLLVSKPSLIKILFHEDKVVGFLFAFPDLSAALQRARGRLTPFSLPDILTEARRTDTLIVNGAGILPEYQMLGGNGLLYHELVRTVRDSGYRKAEMVQIAETTTLMLKDMQTLGGRIYKTHRLYRRRL